MGVQVGHVQSKSKAEKNTVLLVFLHLLINVDDNLCPITQLGFCTFFIAGFFMFCHMTFKAPEVPKTSQKNLAHFVNSKN